MALLAWLLVGVAPVGAAPSTQACVASSFASYLTDSAAGASPAYTKQIRTYRADGSLAATPTAARSVDNEDLVTSPNGSALAWSGVDAASGVRHVFAADADGTHVRVVSRTTAVTDNTNPSWSPDGTKIVWSGKDTATGLFQVYAAPSGGMGPVVPIATGGGTSAWTVAYSFDGTSLAWVGRIGSQQPLVLALADGSSPATLSVTAQTFAWSPIDDRIAWTEWDNENSFVLRVAVGGPSPVGSLLASYPATVPNVIHDVPRWAPDGHAIAAGIIVDGPTGSLGGWATSMSTVVARPDGSQATWLGGGRAVWSPDSLRLAYTTYETWSDATTARRVSGTVMVADRDGQPAAGPTGVRPVTAWSQADRVVRWSSDSATIAWETELWTIPFTTGSGANRYRVVTMASTLGSGTITLVGDSGSPAWSPDGARVAIGAVEPTTVIGGGFPVTHAPVLPAIAAPAGSPSATLTDLAPSAEALWTSSPCPAIRGVAVNAFAMPVAWVTVSAVRPDFTVAATTFTDVFGRYRFASLPAGTYRLRFSDGLRRYQQAWFDGAATFAASTPLSVAAGSTVVANAKLARYGTGRLSGFVYDPATLQRIPGVVISLYSADGYIASTRAGPQGEYELKGIAIGTYTLRFSDPTGAHDARWFVDAALTRDRTWFFMDHNGSMWAATALPPSAP